MTDAGWFIGIAIWLLVGWALFAFYERRAFKKGGKLHSLSRAVYDLGEKWPLSILIFGLLIGLFTGGLGVHFYWHWCPPGSISTGDLKIWQQHIPNAQLDRAPQFVIQRKCVEGPPLTNTLICDL